MVVGRFFSASVLCALARLRPTRCRRQIGGAAARASEADDEVIRDRGTVCFRVVSMQVLLDDLVKEDESGCKRNFVSEMSPAGFSFESAHRFARRGSACNAESPRGPDH